MFLDGADASQLPSAESFVRGLRTVQPRACMLDAYECRPASIMEENGPLTVPTLAEKIDVFKATAADVNDYLHCSTPRMTARQLKLPLAVRVGIKTGTQ